MEQVRNRTSVHPHHDQRTSRNRTSRQAGITAIRLLQESKHSTTWMAQQQVRGPARPRHLCDHQRWWWHHWSSCSKHCIRVMRNGEPISAIHWSQKERIIWWQPFQLYRWHHDICSCMKPLKHQFVHYVHSSTDICCMWWDIVLTSEGGLQIYIMAIVQDVCIQSTCIP